METEQVLIINDGEREEMTEVISLTSLDLHTIMETVLNCNIENITFSVDLEHGPLFIGDEYPLKIRATTVKGERERGAGWDEMEFLNQENVDLIERVRVLEIENDTLRKCIKIVGEGLSEEEECTRLM